MNKLLISFCVLSAFANVIFFGFDGLASVLVALIASALVLLAVWKDKEFDFLLMVFLIAMLIRTTVASMIYGYELELFFGPDSATYDRLGNTLLELWNGNAVAAGSEGSRAASMSLAGWGMTRLVAGLYFFIGRNPHAVQFLSCAAGAATVVGIYFCALKMYSNTRVAKTAAIIIAVCPSLVIWSSQLLKDGFIIFLLVIAMLMVMKLQESFSYVNAFILLGSLAGILSLRFYIFYIAVAAAAGGLFVGYSNNLTSIVRRAAVVAFVGLGFAYLGIFQNSQLDIEKYANLERIQFTRSALSTTADSGFASGTDVSTAGGAVSALPIGFAYLMLSPFPWQISNLRQAITLPEMIIWWLLLPITCLGIWYTVKNRLRSSIVVILFTFVLTAAYSIYQGNVGAAYRQRAQIQVFLFIFASVGLVYLIEQRENRRLPRQKRQ